MAMGMCSDSDLHIRLHLSIYGLFTAAPMPHHVRGKMDKSERNNGGDAIEEKTEAADSKAGDGEQSRSGGKKAKVAQTPKCQVEKCTADLSKEYFRRHRVCELHAKARKVLLLGFEQRFCQQCSRFHALEEFDEAKRSCRRRLAGHNERRRKPPSDSSADRLDANSHHSNNWLTYGGV